ncbi:Fpg/Nei family DNA glycosylase [Nocardioides acrostichi]|uniref:DNA-(apurinic or apyrimidinic site) lyase n=1 Tax=Nocardioides acrostichi TaxID=2784339 RepID=A0A930Y5W0_9ACTN|nr:Fpg/Nei family DNA glycosylase [Nocardioides acrostichi]MBF4160296.1 Fpg/Nei family DNA glycosylase [Nocardioides acrostichi]
MPEGHTLHRLALDLGDAFAGRQVRVTSPQGRFAESAAQIDGTVVTAAQAWGKHLFLDLSDGHHVHVHLGLYGTWAVHRHVPAVPEPVGQVRMRLVTGDGAGTFALADLRGATACDLITTEQRDSVVERLGPDPLRTQALPPSDPDAAWARIRRSRTSIAALLMDQSVLAGVGNVYRAEILFRHRVDPFRPGSSMRIGRWQQMWDDLVVLMHEGVRTNRIDTVRPEHTPEAMGRDPRRDDHGGEVYVYRRDGQPCLVCGARVRTRELAHRNLFWCPRCQPRFRSRAEAARRLR